MKFKLYGLRTSKRHPEERKQKYETLTEKGDKIRFELKRTIAPYLREAGFRGSFPHFRRINGKYVDLITFQFNKWGGSYRVNLAKMPNMDKVYPWGKTVLVNKLTVYDVDPFEKRTALGGSGADYWFEFEDFDTDEEFVDLANRTKKLFIKDLGIHL